MFEFCIPTRATTVPDNPVRGKVRWAIGSALSGTATRVACASVQSIERGIREFMWPWRWKISRGCRCGLLLPGAFLVLYLRRLYAQLDRLTEARGNEVGFRAFP